MDKYGFEIAFGILAVSYIAGMALMLFVTDPRSAAKNDPKPATT